MMHGNGAAKCTLHELRSALVAHASLRAGEAASLPPVHRKRLKAPGCESGGRKRSWKFILSLSKGLP
jgi:hypothetical protein